MIIRLVCYYVCNVGDNGSNEHNKYNQITAVTKIPQQQSKIVKLENRIMHHLIIEIKIAQKPLLVLKSICNSCEEVCVRNVHSMLFPRIKPPAGGTARVSNAVEVRVFCEPEKPWTALLTLSTLRVAIARTKSTQSHARVCVCCNMLRLFLPFKLQKSLFETYFLTLVCIQPGFADVCATHHDFTHAN